MSDEPLLSLPRGTLVAELERLRRRVADLEGEADRRQTEARLLHAQKLESLGLLAGKIAHDFNNFLTSILGNAGLLLRRLSPESAFRPLVSEIEGAAQCATELAEQMLAYSGRVDISTVHSFDLGKLIQGMAPLLKTSVSKKISIQTSFAEDLPPIEGDPSQIRQVVMNLVLNASDAIGEEPGVITVSTGLREADRAYLAETYLGERLSERRYVDLEISDTGCGMDRETRQKIFDPFFTTKAHGRGLGMASVLGIVRRHRGAIHLGSEPGRGTTFRLLFATAGDVAEQVKALVAAAEEKEAGESSWHGTGLVLVVDDDPRVRASAKNILLEFGFDVVLAEDGRRAVELFRDSGDEVSVVLLDMSMPVMDGAETCRELRRLRAGVPVLLTSGFHEQQAKIEELLDEGPAGFLRKPYLPLALMEKIQELVEG